jgi:hypothetical protein
VIAPHPIHGTADRLCVKHTKRLKPGESCPLCPRRPSPAQPAPVATKVKRDGSHAQLALYAALVARGYIDFGATTLTIGSSVDPHLLFVREFSWGSHLTPARRFQADVAFPAMRLLVEIEGIAHKIGSRQKGDVLKSQLATEAGFTLLRVLPIQVHSGEAVALIARALTPAASGTREG